MKGKLSVVLLLMCLACLLPGCGFSSYDDYYKQTEQQTQAVKEYEIEHDARLVPQDVVFIENYGESVSVSTSGRQEPVTVTVLGAKCGGDMSTYESIEGYNPEFIKYLEDPRSKCNFTYDASSKRFINLIRGVGTEIYFIEMEVYNPSSEEVEIAFNSMNVLEYNEEDRTFKDLDIIDAHYYDKVKIYGSKSAWYKIAPGETLRTVMLYVTTEKRIIRQRESFDGSGEKVVEATKTEEYDKGLIYLRPDLTGSYRIKPGEKFIRLKVDE